MKFRTMAAVVLVLALACPAWAGLDMRYVDGLIAMGYYDLAAEHLAEMRAKPGVPAEDMQLIPLRLATIYRMQSMTETDPLRQQKLLDDASKLLDEYVAKNPAAPQILDVRLTQVDLLSIRAQAAEYQYRSEVDAAKKAELLKSLDEMYKKALASAQVIADGSAKRAKELRPKSTTSKAAEAEFWEQYSAQLRGMFLVGQIEYLWAQAYPPADPERKKHLEGSLKLFEDLIKQRPQTNLTFDGYVRKAMCLRDIAPLEPKPEDRDKRYKDAMGAFESALAAEVNDQTRPTRTEAYYQKAVTAAQMGDWDGAASAADAFLRDYAGGKDSFHGQEGLLLKARSLGKRAEQIFAKKEPGWEGLYAEATRTVRDILPSFAAIRGEADRLVQDWNKIFPSSVAVISPLSAAAEAKKLYAEGNAKYQEAAALTAQGNAAEAAAKRVECDAKWSDAIAKYQETITLSGNSPDYADFAEEGWKLIGLMYYNSGRVYQAAIAWEELLNRFPNTWQGADLAWARTKIFRNEYTLRENAAGAGDRFDLDEFLAANIWFIQRFPKDARVFEAQTECAAVYAIRGETVKSADLWASTDPANPRYAECMAIAGDLYRKDFLALVEKNEGASDDAKKRFADALKHLRLAADAPLGPDAKENYNLQSLARIIEMLVDPASPQPESSEKVPALVAEFRSRFKDDKDAMPGVLLAGVQALVTLNRPDDAEAIALDIEKDFGSSYACSASINLMVVAYQKTNPAKANAWQKKTFAGNYDDAPDGTLETLGNRAWKEKNYKEAVECFTRLVTRAKEPDRKRRFEESLAAVYFEAGRWNDATPIYLKFLAEARKAQGSSKTITSDMLLLIRRLAECHEMGTEPKKAVPLWNEYSGVVFRPEGSPEWFEARVHLANAYANMDQFNNANDVLFRVEALYGGFGQDPALQKRLEALKKKTGYETYRKTKIGK